jgi:hypothetical protein
MEAKKRLEISDDKSIPPAPFLGPAVTKPEPKYRQEAGPEARPEDRAEESSMEREPSRVAEREPSRGEESPNLAIDQQQTGQSLPDLAPPPPPPPPQRNEHLATTNPLPPPPPAYAPPAMPPRITPALESLGHSFSETPVLEPILEVFSDHGTPLSLDTDEPTSISVSRREISESLHLYAEVASDFDSWRRQGVDAYENLLDTYGLTFSTWRDIALEWRRKFDRDEDLRSRYESLKTEIQKRKSPRQVS